MRRAAAFAAILLVAGTAVAQPPKKGMRGFVGYADPSDIISDELALHRVAGEKGQWKAFADVAAKDAVLFTPQPVLAQRWLKGQRNPAGPMHWQVTRVVMACDGSVGLSTGIWQSADGRVGRYATLWRRDPKKGDYYWILRADTPLDKADEAPDAIDGRVAYCARRGHRPGAADAAPPKHLDIPVALDTSRPVPATHEDRSDDGTLRWRWSVSPDGARALDAWMATENGEMQILSDRAGPAGS